MGEYDVPVVRIVVKGRPSVGSTGNNVLQARKMLLNAFANEQWPDHAMFAITPGGFIAGRFPKRWEGKRGWSSRRKDFRELVRHAELLVRDVLTAEVLRAARGRAAFLTFGVDLNDWSGKQKMDRRARGTHVELVAVVDVEQGKAVRWTGKSYPVSWQERTLVQETDLESHLFRCEPERVLVLGCHDLNMFSPRAIKKMTPGSFKHTRSRCMRKRVRSFCPTMILHHPHSTDMPEVWRVAWSGARKMLPEKAGKHHVWASAIAFHNGRKVVRGALPDVLTATRCCPQQVIDVLVKPTR